MLYNEGECRFSALLPIFLMEVFMPRRESQYQRDLIGRIKSRFPGCYVTTDLKDQGLPDILVLYGTQWAMLEVKKSAKEVVQPNQSYWVDYFNGWSFAAFIWPENEEQILNALQHTFGTQRQARVS